MRVRPYRTVENVIEGAVLTFVDVTEQQRLQIRLDQLSRVAAEAGTFAQSVLDTVREPQLVLDGKLTVVTANRAFLATFGLAPDEILGQHLRDVYDGAWLGPDLLQLLLEVLPKKKRLDDYVLRLSGGVLGPCTVTINALELLQTPEKRRLMLLTVTGIDSRA
jgi:two-component system CheB/CheR fusion protein